MLVDAVWYRDGTSTRIHDLPTAAERARTEGGFVWVGVHDPSTDEIEHIVDIFDLHPLAAEDAVRSGQRPKLERYGDWLFLVMRTARYLDEPETVEFGEIQVLANASTVIVIRRGEPVPLTALRQRVEQTDNPLTGGPIEIVHAILDTVVDAYQGVLSGLDDDVSEVELEVFSDHDSPSTQSVVERIYFLQRESLEVHRALHPLLTAAPSLRADPLVATSSDWDVYFRDVHDHLLRQADELQTIRELITASLAAHTAQVTLRQNDDMRKISAWVAIAAIPTLLAGIYGMNFEHMPELSWVLGYPLVLTVMIIACAGLYRAFRRTGWL